MDGINYTLLGQPSQNRMRVSCDRTDFLRRLLVHLGQERRLHPETVVFRRRGPASMIKYRHGQQRF